MATGRTSDLWWKNAVVYCLDVETFYDWTGDGRGDLTGLTERLDYLAGMGVSCLWLMPFQPSPNRDDGYDITDYYAVDPKLGTLGDFVALIRTAKDRGLRVIIDLVVNHTSDQHPWFKESRKSKASKLRDHYVWVDHPPADPKPDEVVFPDAETSIWARDERTRQYYLHHFYRHQPDLNIADPQVRDEIAKIVGFWLELGVDGFRVDAVPFLVDTKGTVSADGAPIHLDPHEILRHLRAFITRRKGDAVLLGEVNLPPKGLVKYFGDEDADEVHMLFDFPLMQAMYLSLARGDSRPVRQALARRPPIAEEAQWAVFVRNHDELTLDQLTDKQRQEVFEAFGPDEDMQLFGRGLRRRLPTMLGNDRDWMRLAYSLLFSLPGTPVLFYGEEIGMGENLDIPGRLSVRTPMQWTPDRHGGFTSAPKPVRPLPQGEYGPMAVNVADQRRDNESMLNWMERVIRRRRETPELGWGELTLLDTSDKAVLAHRCDWEDSAVVAVHNFTSAPVEVEADLGDVEGIEELVDLLDGGRGEEKLLDGRRHSFRLGRYEHRWYRLRGPDTRNPP
jgi:maltose alpha-D-glucosyltransferase/alpha-amylase